MKKNNTLVQVFGKIVLSASLLTSTMLMASGSHGGGHEDMSKMQNMDMNKMHKKMTKTNNHMGDHLHNGKMQNHMNSNGKTNAQLAKLKKSKEVTKTNVQSKVNNHMGDHMHNGKMQNHMNQDGKPNAKL